MGENHRPHCTQKLKSLQQVNVFHSINFLLKFSQPIREPLVLLLPVWSIQKSIRHQDLVTTGELEVQGVWADTGKLPHVKG